MATKFRVLFNFCYNILKCNKEKLFLSEWAIFSCLHYRVIIILAQKYLKTNVHKTQTRRGILKFKTERSVSFFKNVYPKRKMTSDLRRPTTGAGLPCRFLFYIRTLTNWN